MNDKNNLKSTGNLTAGEQKYLKEIERLIDKVAIPNPHDPEAVKLWNSVKDLDFIKPEIREKWEKALKNSNIS